ncbi:gamma-tubulin complex component 4 isoform X2 [Schistocerca nitens]|uniref:gamma-tubulin complex component 4 isoform X2 n=1 Tax=Schistocerca nitens TaxID=7011 RepID=UPI0021198428|nr:gamma-tubulin complex component 4 isoform X2 [Schistocerca nitens]
MLHEVLMALAGYPSSVFTEVGGKAVEFMSFIHPGERALLNRVMIIAIDYMALRDFLRFYKCVPSPVKKESSSGGMYLRAFCNALDEVLEPYEKELSELEISALKDPYLPLTFVVSRAEKYSGLFRVLKDMISQIKEQNIYGCSLLGFVHRYLLTGVNDVKSAMKCILHNCHKVFFKQLSSWLLCGVLECGDEFLIKQQKKEDTAPSQSSLGTETFVSHLWELAVEDMKLFLQLKLIKDFFLLGRGELFAEFMHQAESILDKVPSRTSKRDVNRAFQVAAQKVLMTDEAALDKFYFFLPGRAEGVEIKGNGWELLSLKYKVDWPLHLMFTDEVLRNYDRLFSFLLHVKKTQYDLHHIWNDHMSIKNMNYKSKTALWQLRNNLMFVVDNLQYYLQVDVLESQYTILQTAISSTKDFEQIQKAHTIFQANILSQTFLLMSPVDDNTQSVSYRTRGFEDNPVHKTISTLLDLSKSFCAEQQNNPFDETNISKMQQEFHHSMSVLLQLFSTLRSHPCGAHLAQLRLRLDFNFWFSQYAKPSTLNGSF